MAKAKIYYRVTGQAENGLTFAPGKTHKLVAVVDVDEMDMYMMNDVYRKMQGENWSPNGEARELIAALGLHHTSLSVGDVVEIDGVAQVCIEYGWEVVTAIGQYTLSEFIEVYKEKIDSTIQAAGWRASIDDMERKRWILNCKPLYDLAVACGTLKD